MLGAPLTTRQTEEFHKAIIAYLHSVNLPIAAQTLQDVQDALGIDNSFDDAAKESYAGLLEHKWKGVVRLQKKIFDLEKQKDSLQNELDLERQKDSSQNEVEDFETAQNTSPRTDLEEREVPQASIYNEPNFKNTDLIIPPKSPRPIEVLAAVEPCPKQPERPPRAHRQRRILSNIFRSCFGLEQHHKENPEKGGDTNIGGPPLPRRETASNTSLRSSNLFCSCFGLRRRHKGYLEQDGDMSVGSPPMLRRDTTECRTLEKQADANISCSPLLRRDTTQRKSLGSKILVK
jgi:hypothetical protein